MVPLRAFPHNKFANHSTVPIQNSRPMKDKVQIALLSVIAIALVALAATQFMGKGESSNDSPSNIVAEPATSATPALQSFDPTATTTETVDNTPKTVMTFGSYEHDFGNINQDSENKKVFKFTNTGKEPLLIESATGSCGCTVPSYPKQPIAPGATGEIEVVYKPGKQENAQTKQVTVIANTEPRETVLRIKAFVEATAS